MKRQEPLIERILVHSHQPPKRPVLPAMSSLAQTTDEAHSNLIFYTEICELSLRYTHPLKTHPRFMRSRIQVIVTLMLIVSMLPALAQAGGARWNTGDLEISPSIAIPGEIVEIRIEALDAEEKYEVWVEDSEGQYRFERHNQTTNNEVLIYEWTVSPNIPTGQYSLCLGIWDTDWWDDEYIALEGCDSFWVMSRKVITESPHDAVLPGSTVVVNGAITHPWTNEPIFADRVEYLAEYFIDEDGLIDYRTQTGTLNSITGIFSFQFDIPLNVPQGDWLYSDIVITVWANGSSGQQSDSTTLVVECGSFSFEWIATGSGSTLLQPGIPVLLEARALVDGYWEWAPLENHTASLSIWQDDIKRPIVVGLNSGARGKIQFMLDIGDLQGLHSGSAILELQGSSPVDGSTVTSNTTVFLLLDDDAIGQGINVNLRENGGPWNPGDSARIDVLVTDDADQPLPHAWFYWTISDSDDNYGYLLNEGLITSDIRLSQVDVDGKAQLNIQISEDHQSSIQDMHVRVTASNSTGWLDSDSITLNIEEPGANIATDSIVFSPGDNIQCSLLAWGLEGNIVWIWQSSDGQSGVVEGTASSVAFSVQIPDAHDEYSWQINVEVIDESGRQVSDSVTLQQRQGHTIEVDLPWGTPKAGEVIEVEYILHSLESDGRLDLPMSWHSGIAGDEENNREGIVTSASGTVPLALPEDLSSGSYLAVIQIGGASSYLVVEIADEESLGAANLAGDVAGAANPTLTILALIIAVVAMILSLRRKGGSDALGMAEDGSPNTPEESVVNKLPPPSLAPVPPTAAPNPAAPPPASGGMPQPSIEQMAQGSGGTQQFPPVQPPQ